MKFIKCSSLVLAVVVLIVVGSGSVQSSPGETRLSPSPDRGMYVFEAYCAGCHGISGAGDGPMSAVLERDFGMSPTDLSDAKFQANRTDSQLRKAVRGGGKAVHKTPFMPAWGETLSDKQVGDLVSYIRDLKDGMHTGRPTLIGVGEQLEFGRVLYGLHCLACHGPKGQGDGPFLKGITQGEAGVVMTTPPDMSERKFFRRFSDRDLEKLIKKGMPHGGFASSTSKWWHKQLRDGEIDALIFYLRALPLAPRAKQKGV